MPREPESGAPLEERDPATEERTGVPGEGEPDGLRERIVDALREIYDPEIPVNIYDLGLIYDIEIDPAGAVEIRMTLTTPGCPVAQTFPESVEMAVAAIEGVSAARVEVVWDPPWTMDRMDEAARLQLGLF